MTMYIVKMMMMIIIITKVMLMMTKPSLTIRKDIICFSNILPDIPSAINRGYYMAARRYEIYLRVLKNISRVRAANE